MMDNKAIANETFTEERCLCASRSIALDSVCMDGAQALRRSENVHAKSCTFNGFGPLCECSWITCQDSHFNDGAANAMWHTNDIELIGCIIEADMFIRHAKNVRLTNCKLTNARGALWDCENVYIHGCTIDGADDLAFHSRNVCITDTMVDGERVLCRVDGLDMNRCVVTSNGAMGSASNMRTYNTKVAGDGFLCHSSNCTVWNCEITGTRPMCSCDSLQVIDCTVNGASDAFEDSSVDATIDGMVDSIKNPKSGKILCESVGTVHFDMDCIGDGAVVKCASTGKVYKKSQYINGIRRKQQ